MLQGATKLSKQDDMKNVKGGSNCAPGEFLYSCTITYENGNSFTGYACGDSQMQAQDKAQAVHDIDGGVSVNCVRN